MRSTRFRIITGGVLFLLAALMASPNAEPISTDAVELSQDSQDSVSTAPKGKTPAPAQKASPEMVLQPGEALVLSTLPDTGFLNGVYPVDDQGYAHFPVVGMVKVAGIPIPQLQENLKQEFIDYLRYPTLTVKPLIRVSLMGGFARPGLYYVSPSSNLWEAVRMGGGMQRKDGIEKLRWKRDREFVAKDVVPYFQSGNSLRAIGFKSGDQLLVTQRPDRTGWEVFRQEVLPVLSAVLSTATTAASLYLTYEAWKDNR